MNGSPRTGLTRRAFVKTAAIAGIGGAYFGGAHLVLLPAETFVQYQLWAQQMRPDSFVMTAGFGECAPGYIPTAQAASEGYEDHYSWIAFPECEAIMLNALRQVLRKS